MGYMRNASLFVSAIIVLLVGCIDPVSEGDVYNNPFDPAHPDSPFTQQILPEEGTEDLSSSSDSATTTVAWTPVQDALGYQLEWDTEESFASSSTAEVDGPEAIIEVQTEITVFWRVRFLAEAVLPGESSVSSDWSPWHGPWSFGVDRSDTESTTPNTYTVTYSANGADSGSAPSDQTKTESIDLTLASNSGNLQRTGFTFAGWNTTSDGTGTSYTEGASYATDADLTLYAQWVDTESDLGGVADAFVRADSPSSNYGSADYIKVGNHDASAYEYRTLIQLDLSNRPANALQAHVRLYYLGNPKHGNPSAYPDNNYATEVAAYRISEPWEASSVTWATRPSIDSTSPIKAATVFPSSTDGSYVEIDITDWYNGWQSGVVSNHGIEIRGSDTFQDVWYQSSFVSTESTEYQDYKPRLIVTEN